MPFPCNLSTYAIAFQSESLPPTAIPYSYSNPTPTPNPTPLLFLFPRLILILLLLLTNTLVPSLLLFPFLLLL